MNKLFVALALFPVVVIAAIVYFYVKDYQEWEAYAEAYHCTTTGNEKSETWVQPTYTGNGFIYIPKTITKKNGYAMVTKGFGDDQHYHFAGAEVIISHQIILHP